MTTRTMSGFRDRRWYRWAAAVTAGGLLLLGCTGSEEQGREESPPPANEEVEEAAPLGREVAVVLPPRSTLSPGVLDQVQAAIRELPLPEDSDVRNLRTAVPETEEFVADVARLMARDGAALTCVVGAGGRSLVRELRDLYPDRRFCAVTTDDPPDEPREGIDVVVLRAAEVGHLVGAVAEELVGEADPGRVALALAPTELQQERFRAGVIAGFGGGVPIEVDPDEPPAAAVAAAVADGAEVLIVGTGPDARAVLEAALAQGLVVLAHGDLVDDDDLVHLTWREHWPTVLAPALDRLHGKDDPAPLSLGLAEGAFRTELGPGAPDDLEVVLLVVRKELIDGVRDPVQVVEPDREDDVEEPTEPE